MFGDISNVFSRTFIVGHFLPAILFVTANMLIFTYVSPLSPPFSDIPNQIGTIWAVPAALVAAWIIGVTLLTGNRVLIRLLEGYHLLNHSPLHRWEKNRFDRLNKKLADITEKGKREKEKHGKASAETEKEYSRLLRDRLASFPASEGALLATSLGNTIRAFEMYSLDVHGIDAIPFWPRIIAMVPTDFRETIQEAKSYVDAAINIFYLSIFIALESIVITVVTKPVWILSVVILALCGLAAIFSYQLSISAARQWGETVKAVFDLYRYDLLEQLGLENTETWEEERTQWEQLNKCMIYHYPWNKLHRKKQRQGGENA